ncbi:MAG TPA: hypothetical protein VND92_02755 [Vicinamibacterales bacterium]|nr:hypothetical protein [Vicinamibacterales bacterium]
MADHPVDDPQPSNARTYLLVVLIEIIVVTALWIVGRHFGG